MEKRMLKKERAKRKSSWEIHVSVFLFFTFMPFVACPTYRRTKYLQNRWSLTMRISTKKIQISILNSSWEIHVSVFLHLLMPFVAWRTKYLQNRWSYVRGIYTRKLDLYLNYSLRKSCFPLNLMDILTYIQTDGH